jgi:hypothetical protein
MRFVQLLKVLPLRRTAPYLALSPNSAITTIWRTERSGIFGEYVVSGWRYTDLAIWHVKIWSTSDEEAERTYVVSAGEFYPESIAPPEKFAAQQLIAFWEADGFEWSNVPGV